jgi:hypothetical protein
MLNPNPTYRLGGNLRGPRQALAHPFFGEIGDLRAVNWAALANGEVESPMVPSEKDLIVNIDVLRDIAKADNTSSFRWVDQSSPRSAKHAPLKHEPHLEMPEGRGDGSASSAKSARQRKSLEDALSDHFEHSKDGFMAAYLDIKRTLRLQSMLMLQRRSKILELKQSATVNGSMAHTVLRRVAVAEAVHHMLVSSREKSPHTIPEEML